MNKENVLNSLKNSSVMQSFGKNQSDSNHKEFNEEQSYLKNSEDLYNNYNI